MTNNMVLNISIEVMLQIFILHKMQPYARNCDAIAETSKSFIFGPQWQLNTFKTMINR